MFMHGSLLHLGGNMLFLWIFGNNIEDSMGRLRFVAFYLLGGLAALARPGRSWTRTPPSRPWGRAGRSRRCSAAMPLLYPRARVVTLVFIIIFFTVIELPALLVLGLWFLLQLLHGASDSAAGGRRRRRGVLRAHRRLRVRPAARSSCSPTRCTRTTTPAAPYARVLMARTLVLAAQPRDHLPARLPHRRGCRRGWSGRPGRGVSDHPCAARLRRAGRAHEPPPE